MKHSTLRQIFGRRLLLLLGSFSVAMSTIIVLAYQHQTDQLNRSVLQVNLTNFMQRIHLQQRVWDDDADHILDIVEWSGLLNLKEPARKAKLQAFFAAQADSMEFEGIVITDAGTGKPVFDFWNNAETPDLQLAISENAPIWHDDKHAILYTRIHKTSPALGHNFNTIFFKAWDSAMLRRLGFPGTITYISLGNQALLSSAGNLALESSPPSIGEYSERILSGIKYQEGSYILDDELIPGNQPTGLMLTLRSPIKNNLPMPLVLTASIGITLLFGMLLFLVFGRWLTRIGARLDALAHAALNFQREPAKGFTAETRRLLEFVDSRKEDQISVVAHELSSLMSGAAQRHEEQRAYLQTLDLLQDAVIEFTVEGRLLRATDAWKAMTGMDDFSSYGLVDWVHPEDVSGLMEQISALIHNQKKQVNIRFRMHRQRDFHAHFWVEGRFAPVKHGDQITSIRGVVRDITSTYDQERQISHMALHDALTDLPNRVLLEDRMQMAITRAARGNQRVALCFLDLDHFKQVNDNFGHKLGDRMLKEVSQRLQSSLRGTDTLSRWGGDEFVVLCPDLDSLEDARDISMKLSLLARENITIDGTDFPFTFSAGFAVYPDDANNSEMLLAQADRAMFYAKAQGRNNIQFFNSIAGKETGRQSFYIQSRLLQAVNNDQILCWLQPLVAARTGKVIGAEALARWHEPEQGWISPSVFIPMAESLGLIDKVGQSVWQQALHALTLLPAHHRLSMNLSKRQLFSNTIVQQLLDDLAHANIEPGRIMLEITESIALSEVTYARERIIELDAKGFGISIDDFGVGYSSLSQLHEIPAAELKLDISFVKRIHDKTGLSMATAIISIAKSLNLECVAESVEDEPTAELLRTMGVEILQGYHFARPMPIDDYLSWLSERTSLQEQT
ncbi:MAG: putative bifunctional diguanylate cyclase/phosphodiesterase [Pseudomonadota bacterium]